MKAVISTKFQVIDGKKKTTEWWHEKYKSIIDNILLNLDPYDRYQYMRLCRYLVKDFNCICKLEDNNHLIFQAGIETTQLLARLTPKEFLITFIPNKTYDGKKYECIDYFSTIEKFLSMDMFSFIGEDKIEDVLWGYDNSDLLHFNVNIMCALSKIYRQQNGTDIFDDFLQECGKEPLPKYYKVKALSGKKILVDETGKKVNTKKVYPKHIRRVK